MAWAVVQRESARLSCHSGLGPLPWHSPCMAAPATMLQRLVVLQRKGCPGAAGVATFALGGLVGGQTWPAQRSAVTQSNQEAWKSELVLHEGIGSKWCARRDGTLLILGQSPPNPRPRPGTAIWLEVSDASWFLASSVAGVGCGAIEEDARMLPQRDCDLVVQLADPLRCSNNVDLVQVGKNGFVLELCLDSLQGHGRVSERGFVARRRWLAD